MGWAHINKSVLCTNSPRTALARSLSTVEVWRAVMMDHPDSRLILGNEEIT